MAKSPAAILYDSDGHPVGVALDGSIYRLQMSAKVARASDGAFVNPATQETLAAIKDTDGVKKILDALPIGDNRIGKIKVTDDTNVLGVDAQNHAYVAGKSAAGVAPSSNPVSVSGVDGGGLKRTLLTDTVGRLLVVSPGSNSQVKGFSGGFVVLAATAPAAIYSTTYTEQTSNAQRSLVSASANDSAAGTGARKVIIRYYTATFTGPFEEEVTLNGTTPVNTVATDICYIECLRVSEAGAGASIPAGIISLKAATGGGGATIWTIAAGGWQTYGAHHYVPTGYTCNITGFYAGIKGADSGAFFIRAQDLSAANKFNRQVSDTVRVVANGSFLRDYGTPIQVAGPARIQGWVTPDSTSSRTYYGSFDFYDQSNT
jgi:hypothetical protein